MTREEAIALVDRALASNAIVTQYVIRGDADLADGLEEASGSAREARRSVDVGSYEGAEEHALEALAYMLKSCAHLQQRTAELRTEVPT